MIVGSGTSKVQETFPASTAWSVLGGSSVRVRVALRSVRPTTWLAKAMTSVELDRYPFVRFRHIRVGYLHLKGCAIAGLKDDTP